MSVASRARQAERGTHIPTPVSLKRLAYTGPRDGSNVKYRTGTEYTVNETGFINTKKELKRREKCLEALMNTDPRSVAFRDAMRYRAVTSKFLTAIIGALEEDKYGDVKRLDVFRSELAKKLEQEKTAAAKPPKPEPTKEEVRDQAEHQLKQENR